MPGMTDDGPGTGLPRSADVVVVGGGAVGASTAYHLAAGGAGSVLLLEREAALGTGSTGRCAGGFRQQFSSAINVRLSLASIPLIVGFSETHGIPLDVVQDGYLFLVRDEGTWRSFRAAAAMQRSLGAQVHELDAREAAALVPGIAIDGLIGATYGPQDGLADPSGLTQGYATIARRAGAQIRTGVDVQRIRVERGAVHQTEQQTNPPRGGLGSQARSERVLRVHLIEGFDVEARQLLGLTHTKRGGTTSDATDLAEQRNLGARPAFAVLAALAHCGRGFENTLAPFAHHATNLDELVRIRVGARHNPTVRNSVQCRARAASSSCQ